MNTDEGEQQPAPHRAAGSRRHDRSGRFPELDTWSRGLEHAIEVVAADAGAIVYRGRVVTSVGYDGDPPADALVAVAAGSAATAPLPAARSGQALSVSQLGAGRVAMVLVRAAAPFSERERGLLQRFRRLLGLAVWTEQSVASVQEQNRLLERLTRIQRSISHRAPLHEVLDAITLGASELLSGSVAGLRLVDPNDPRYLVLMSSHGMSEEIVAALRRGPVGEGAGGRAIAENRLIIIEGYEHSQDGLPALAADHLQTAMAAPVHEHGRVAGSLTVGSYEPGRRYSEREQAALLALAEHTSLALSDARTVAALREAQHSHDLFLAMVSHELRTPLTVVMATLRTLEGRGDSLPPERRAQMLRTAWERGRDLERLIDGLLQSARAELSINAEVVAVRDLVAGAIAGFEQRGRIDVGTLPDTELLTDPAAVRAVLRTLLENALVHSPGGTAIALECTADRGGVSVAVRNEGSLPAELQPEELFRPFRRGGQVRSSGVGLGLHIAARLTQSLGGELSAESAQGMVTFRLRLPLRAPMDA